MIGSLAGDRGTLVKWEMLDGIDSPPVRELQLMCGHYYLFDIDPSLSGWYEAGERLEWIWMRMVFSDQIIPSC